MQLVYLIDIFEDNDNIVRDRFETDSANVMKKGCSKETKEISIYINLTQLYQKTMKTVTRNNNTQNVHKATLVCDKLLRNLKTWKSIGLIIWAKNTIIKSSQFVDVIQSKKSWNYFLNSAI